MFYKLSKCKNLKNKIKIKSQTRSIQHFRNKLENNYTSLVVDYTILLFRIQVDRYRKRIEKWFMFRN